MKYLIRKFLSFAGSAALAALMFAMPQAADAQYRVFYENGKAGIADSSGTVLVPAKYEKLYQLGDSENARFGGAGKYGMLDIKTGKILLPDKYKSIGDFYCGLAYINDNGKFGFVDRAGNIVIAPQFDSAASFYDGVSQVTKNGRSYYIGVDGKEYSDMPSADELAAKEYVAPAQPHQESASAPAKHASASTAYESGTDYEESPDAASPKDWRKGVPTPYLSWNTAYIQRKVPFDQLEESGVSEGIFWLREYNRKIGYGSYYGFWTIDGRCLFPAMYESFTEGLPRFDSGACVVKEAEAKMHSPVILYADGTTKHLSHEWEAMTQFRDGVAMVREILGKKTINLFYINTKGEKIWNHLAENDAKGGIAINIRPLREGRRAFYSNSAKAWGFLDEKGKVVIPPRFKEARDFAEGHALVIIPAAGGSGKAVFIDKNGEAVVDVPGDVPSLLYSAKVSDIGDGCFAVSDPSGKETAFYDLSGKKLAFYSGGASGFSGGYAFAVDSKYGETVIVVNRDFTPVGKLPFETRDFPVNKPVFTTYPYFTYDRFVAIDQKGKPELQVPDGIFVNDRLGQFSHDGFAPAASVFAVAANSASYEYTGIVDSDGCYRVVFCDSEGAGGPFASLPGPKPVHPEPLPVPNPPLLRLPQPEPVGPIGPGSESVRYRVRVIACPEKGGKVFGSGEYAYGDTIRVTGTPAKGYMISAIESSNPMSSTDVFNRFVVRGDMDIRCYFTPEDELLAPGTAALSGTLRKMPYEVYLQLGEKEGNRYPDPSSGFLAIITDGVDASSKGKDASISVNFFFVPMNVAGITEDNGKRYLRLDGGVMKYGNLSISDNSGAGMLNNPLFSMMLAFDGADKGELSPASYRVEILDGSAEKGYLKLGEMQRRSPKYGWISADDPSFNRPLGGFFFKRVDKGLPADMFNGLELRKTGKKSVKWEPDAGFYGGNQPVMESFSSQLGELFRRKAKDTPLSDYDMKQFSEDLDNHLFKMK